MDLVHVQTTFNDGVLNITGKLDLHYANNLEWTIDSAVVSTYEYSNGVGQFVPITPATGEIDTTDPAEIHINISSLENKLVKVQFYINMHSNPYILCGFEQDVDSPTTIIQSNYFVDLYEFYEKILEYMTDLSTACCDIPRYLVDTILKYFLLKSSLAVKNLNVILPIYLELYYATQNTTPLLTLHSTYNYGTNTCNCHG